jgi:hypothetical protein
MVEQKNNEGPGGALAKNQRRTKFLEQNQKAFPFFAIIQDFGQRLIRPLVYLVQRSVCVAQRGELDFCLPPTTVFRAALGSWPCWRFSRVVAAIPI